MLKKPLVLFILMLASHSTMADELVIGIGQQGSEALQQAKPERGMTQAQVESTYGAPAARTEPNGNPPIETWHYDYFSVYFEGDTVIHSVIKHIRQDQPGEQTQ